LLAARCNATSVGASALSGPSRSGGCGPASTAPS
jgi:hypothetical protein